MPFFYLLRQLAKFQTKREIGRSRDWRSRVRQIEKLEARNMFAAAIWHNVLQPLDVSGDVGGAIDPLDVLVMINEINDPKFSNQGHCRQNCPQEPPLPSSMSTAILPLRRSMF